MDQKWTDIEPEVSRKLAFLRDSISTVISVGMSDNDFDLLASSSIGDVII